LLMERPRKKADISLLLCGIHQQHGEEGGVSSEMNFKDLAEETSSDREKRRQRKKGEERSRPSVEKLKRGNDLELLRRVQSIQRRKSKKKLPEGAGKSLNPKRMGTEIFRQTEGGNGKVSRSAT